ADFDGDGLGDACDPDDDNDGVPDALDCAPLNPAVSSVPAEVTGVAVTKGSGTSVAWSASLGSGIVYDVAGGGLDALRAAGGASGASCLQNDAPGTTWNDPRPDPAAGAGYYYLVRGQNVCGGGTYGYATGGSERLPASACP